MQEKTIKQYLVPFLDYLEIEKGLANRTQKNYADNFQSFLHWLRLEDIQDITPSQLTKDHVAGYRQYLLRRDSFVYHKKMTPETRNCYLQTIRSLLSYFEDKGIKCLSPSEIRLSKIKKRGSIKVLSLDELTKIMDEPDTSTIIGLRDRAILEVLFSTGLRVTELVTLDRDQIRILKDTDFLEVSITGKGSRVRPVYFSERALKWLKNYLDMRKDIDPAVFVNYRKDADLLPSCRLTSRSVQRLIKRYVKQAGVPIDATPHTFRHSFATDLMQQGVDTRMVQEFLGHKNLNTTQIYTHVTNKRLKDLHSKIHKKGRMKDV